MGPQEDFNRLTTPAGAGLPTDPAALSLLLTRLGIAPRLSTEPHSEPESDAEQAHSAPESGVLSPAVRLRRSRTIEAASQSKATRSQDGAPPLAKSKSTPMTLSKFHNGASPYAEAGPKKSGWGRAKECE